ncbi:MAG: potassium transporter Kup [Hyphomonadaceae bacterium]|nr:potassium transporter Kup [Hyphomonadaceae bacterium]
MQDRQQPNDAAAHRSSAARGSALVIGSLGVVFGDVGTSPLYALREALHPLRSDGLERAEVLGVVSLTLWTLLVLVTIKYVFFIMRLANKGEGGILALLGLAQRGWRGPTPGLLIFAGVIGAALFYGDAILTPAISILSAVEGLKVAAPGFDEVWVMPISLAIIVGLFAVQSRGTGPLARWFGPVMLAWFVAIGAIAVPHIARDPAILNAFNPVYGVQFMAAHGWTSFMVLGSVFLCVTGAEALYADLGHFGRKPITVAWMWIAFPTLALNYLGQGALVVADAEAADSPFFLMAPQWFVLPLVALATAATVIASQAIITGAFSLTQQAVQLGLLPRLEIRHTSPDQRGQIFAPAVNTLIAVGVVLLVLGFQTSSALASAFGLAVTGTMLMTSFLAFVVVRRLWRWSLWTALLVMTPMIALEIVFLAANAAKLLHGAWFPLAFGAVLCLLMMTWMRGTAILAAQARANQRSLTEVIEEIARSGTPTTPGVAVFLTNDPETAPGGLLANLKHNRVVHEQNFVVSVHIDDAPTVDVNERAVVDALAPGWTRIALRFGFMETPNVPAALAMLRKSNRIDFAVMQTSFFLARRTILPSPERGMPLWRDNIYVALTRVATNAVDYFCIPRERSIEIGEKLSL